MKVVGLVRLWLGVVLLSREADSDRDRGDGESDDEKSDHCTQHACEHQLLRVCTRKHFVCNSSEIIGECERRYLLEKTWELVWR